MSKINLADKLSQFEGHWQPRVVGAFNGHDLMVVKFQGQFPWHSHADTDDFFLVLKGQMIMRLRDGDVLVRPGEVFVVPKGVEHAPFAGLGNDDAVRAILGNSVRHFIREAATITRLVQFAIAYIETGLA